MKEDSPTQESTELVSGLALRREWMERVLTAFSLSVIVFCFFEIRHEIAKPSKDFMTIFNEINNNVATFMTVAFGFLVIITHGVDRIMFRYAAYLQKAAKARAEGRAEGEAKERQLWLEWYNRKLAAEAKGEPFDEPPPAEKEIDR